MLLTKEIRAKIVDAAVAKSAVPKMRAKVDAGKKKLAKLAYSLIVDLPPEIEALPAEVKKGWLNKITSLEIDAPGFARYRRVAGSDDELSAVLRFDDPVLVPKFFGVARAKDHPKLQTAAAALLKEHREANHYEEELRGKLRAIVQSCNTRDQLLKTWPEGKRFIPVVPAKTRSLVDTATLIDVNAQLGIKV